MEVIKESIWLRIIRRFVRWSIIGLSLFFFTAAISITALLYLRSQPLPPDSIQETTTIYAQNGEPIDHIHVGQNRRYIPLEQIPEHVLHAFIAVEDKHFYSHFGLDLRRIGGAMLNNVRQLSIVEGASTITQQLARNLYLNHERTWERKLKEAQYTLQLEMKYSKQEILEKYLNQIYFGHSAYGIYTAANMFFSKEPSALSIAEGALLAAIPKGPGVYSPWINLDNALQRQQLILKLMYEQHYITKAELETAAAEHVLLNDQEQVMNSGRMAPYFRDYVRQEAIRTYGIEEEAFQQGGLRIYTTLNPDIQTKAEQAMDKFLPDDRDLQGALLAIDPQTGYILAMVGGRNYAQSQFNRVLAMRHPGSAIKPLLYYAGLEEGLTPLTLMTSEPTTFTYDNGRATYTPQNFNDQYENDFITMDRAIARSDNIYAIKTAKFIGLEKFIATLHHFGLTQTFRPLPSLALGAQNVTLFQMVHAYTALANLGTQPQPLAITKIEDRNGQVLVDNQIQTEQILDPAHTYVLNEMLRSVFKSGGTGHHLSAKFQRPVWGKTGTTQTDAWMLGFTPQITAGVWIGYDREAYINHNNDGRLASYIWAEFIESVLAEEEPVFYDVPANVTAAYVNPENGRLATEHCPVQRLLFFKKGTEPDEYCPEHIPEQDDPPEPLIVDDPQATLLEKLRKWLGN